MFSYGQSQYINVIVATIYVMTSKNIIGFAYEPCYIYIFSMFGASHTHNIRHMIINDERLWARHKEDDWPTNTNIIWVIIMRKIQEKVLGGSDYGHGVCRWTKQHHIKLTYPTPSILSYIIRKVFGTLKVECRIWIFFINLPPQLRCFTFIPSKKQKIKKDVLPSDIINKYIWSLNISKPIEKKKKKKTYQYIIDQHISNLVFLFLFFIRRSNLVSFLCVWVCRYLIRLQGSWHCWKCRGLERTGRGILSIRKFG